MSILIKVENEDIQSGDRPIENAVRRQHGLDCTVDARFIQFRDNPASPRRLPAIAEDFMYKLHVGEKVYPIEFEI